MKCKILVCSVMFLPAFLHPPLTTYLLPLTTYFLLPTGLPLTDYRSPITFYLLPLTDHHPHYLGLRLGNKN